MLFQSKGEPVRPQSRSITLSVVIPAFNERYRLEETLYDLESSLAKIDHLTAEIIVVDDGSTDNTTEVAEDTLNRLSCPGTVVRFPSNRGKGVAVRTGVQVASGTKIMFMDADGATNPCSIPILLDLLDDYDFVIGSRSLSTSRVTCADPRRPIMGKIFNQLASRIAQIDYLDTQCGFKGFTAEVAKLLFHFLKSPGYAFDVELLYLAKKLGIKVVELPVEWEHKQGSHIQLWKDPFTMTKEVVQTRYRMNGPPRILTAVLTARSNWGTTPYLAPLGGIGEWVEILRGTLDKGCTVLTSSNSVILVLPFTSTTAIPSLEVKIKKELGECDITWMPMSLAQLASSKVMDVQKQRILDRQDTVAHPTPASNTASDDPALLDPCLEPSLRYGIQTAC